ncbi:MAG: hypothetical protein LKE43_00220 [Olsenella sp.]|nr:hypothetical protein [Olsenella sp.]
MSGHLYTRPADVDAAAIGLDGELVAGECEWEARLTGSDVLGTLADRAELVRGGASRTLLFLFSKTGFTDECKVDAFSRGNVRLVTVDEMFEP